MNKNQFEGKVNKLQGDVKMAVGQAVKNDKLKSSGAMDKLKGNIQEDIGDVQEKIKIQSDKLSDELINLQNKSKIKQIKASRRRR